MGKRLSGLYGWLFYGHYGWQEMISASINGCKLLPEQVLDLAKMRPRSWLKGKMNSFSSSMYEWTVLPNLCLKGL